MLTLFFRKCLAVVCIVDTLWLLWFLPQHPLWAALGVLVISLGFFGVTGVAFTALYLFGFGVRPGTRQGPILDATPLQLLRAWWGECVVMGQFGMWWAPFRINAQPDFLPAQPTGQRGVVLIHGYVCNRAIWMPWFPRLRQEGHAYVAVSLEPIFTSIDNYVPAIEAAVQAVTLATGLPPVLVCHSMGGLVARAWLRSDPHLSLQNAARIHRIITIGTPHHGTWLGRWNSAYATPNAVQMAQNSPWLQALETAEMQHLPQGYAPFTCFYSHCDNIVFPLETATLAGADNRHVPGVAHVAMAVDDGVINQSFELITRV
jgi:pimeloyl-ACP methyl ester carboxylesterase